MTSFIELDTPSMTADQVSELETAVNDKIRACVPMYPTLYSGIDDPALSEVSCVFCMLYPFIPFTISPQKIRGILDSVSFCHNIYQIVVCNNSQYFKV